MTVERPWPGPVPYGESDARRFHGRERDISDLVERVRSQQFTVLIALSGVGKTSLLQAGLVPRLREERRHLGPTLVLSGWGLMERTHPGEMLSVAIHQEVAASSECPRNAKAVSFDRGAATPEEAVGRLLDYVDELCEELRGMVLVIDQAEELLGSGLAMRNEDAERLVLGALGTLSRDVRRVRILLSLREEYYGRLKELERYVTSLNARTKRLDRLQRPQLAAALEAASAVPGLVLEEGVIPEIITWHSSGVDPDGVDLLRVQALLAHLLDWHEARQGADGHVSITKQSLGEYREAMGAVDPTEEALQIHIDRALNLAAAELDDSVVLPNHIVRAVARVADGLSSGGYKRHTDEGELVFQAVREDLRALGARADDTTLRLRLREFCIGLARHHEIALGELNYQEEAGEDRRDRLSGPARRGGWDLDVTATVLARAAWLGLHALNAPRARIVKIAASSQSEARACELVHDGFGPALIHWAERKRGELADTLAALVSRRGETFPWRAVAGTAHAPTVVSDVVWLGCSLWDATLTHVRFERCILRGSIFRRCHLEDLEFIDCDLSGVVFKGGQWRNVRISGRSAESALMVGVEVGGAQLTEVSFKGATFVGTRFVGGNSTFESCDLRFSQMQWISAGGCVTLRRCDVRRALLTDASTVLHDCHGEADLQKSEMEEAR